MLNESQCVSRSPDVYFCVGCSTRLLRPSSVSDTKVFFSFFLVYKLNSTIFFFVEKIILINTVLLRSRDGISWILFFSGGEMLSSCFQRSFNAIPCRREHVRIQYGRAKKNRILKTFGFFSLQSVQRMTSGGMSTGISFKRFTPVLFEKGVENVLLRFKNK